MNTRFPREWERFVTGKYEEGDVLLAMKFVLFFTSCESPELKRIGYRLALLHAYYKSDFSLLHAIASSQGLAPITKSIENSSRWKQLSSSGENGSVIKTIRDSLSETLSDGDVFYTVGQRVFQEQFEDQAKQNVSVVAPTSYGKSSLIVDYIENNQGSICIIVPTKSLLSQTRRTLIHNLKRSTLQKRKIITHHEMFAQTDVNIIAVFTQERFLKFQQENPDTKIDHLFVDESHNLFSNDGRSRALVSSILLCSFNNRACVVKFLSPFIASTSSLQNRLIHYELETLSTSEYLKSERIFIINYQRKSPLYKRWIFDQFVGKEYLFDQVSSVDFHNYVVDNAGQKNIIYLNKPTTTHDVATKLATLLPDIDSVAIDEACSQLAGYLDKNYLLIKLLKKGIVCHHGSIPETVRSYLEKVYSKNPEVRFVITTSTLLEGVNIPASKMFVLSSGKGRGVLSRSQTKNLIGRVARLNDVFSNKDVTMLTPEVHFVGCIHYRKNTNLINFVKTRLKEGGEERDEVKNPMLEKGAITESNQEDLITELNYLSSVDESIVATISEKLEITPSIPQTEEGKFCLKNRLSGFNIFEQELEIQKSVTELQRLKTKAKDAVSLIETINIVFLKNLPEEIIGNDDNLIRLRDNFSARDFYAMILEWRILNKSYSEMISKFIKYWRSIEDIPTKQVIYAGRWGLQKRDNDDKSFTDNYVNLKELDHPSRVTLAVARIEAEMSYLDYNVMKYVNTLYDMDLVDLDFYDRVKYGTNDENTQNLMRSGMSSSLAKLFSTDDLSKFIHVNVSGIITIRSNVIDLLKRRGVNDLLIHEAEMFIY